MKKNFKIKLVIIFIFAFFFSRNVLAASLELNTDKNTLQENGTFTLTLSLDTEGDSINTIEGDLKYDENFVKPETLNIGNSFVSFWVEKPDFETPGIIHFSGVTPGGISAPSSEVFEVVFRTKNAGDTSLSLENVNLFLNDGKGSTVEAKIKNADIKINQGENSNETVNPTLPDKIPPEKFSIIRAESPSLFDNKYFIAFSTVDKGSGVDYYQVCEFFGCVKASSPFLLRNQTPFYYIRVKAYDMNGNSISSSLVSLWFILAFVLIFLVLFMLVFYFYRRYFHFNKL